MCDGRYCMVVYKITRTQMLHKSTKNSMSDAIVMTGTMFVYKITCIQMLHKSSKNSMTASHLSYPANWHKSTYGQP